MEIPTYLQSLDPIAGTSLFGYELLRTSWWSTFFAGLPVLVLFWLLVPRRWLAPKAAAGAVSAIIVAIFIFGMSWDQTLWSFAFGVGFGVLPVGWTIFHAMLLYNITVETGQFTIIRRSVASLSADAHPGNSDWILFGAFLEGAAGGGTPVAICGAIMVGLGFDPFLAAVLCLIANTSPVAYGGLGTPILVLSDVTNLPAKTLSTMAGHQLPLVSLFIPMYMIKCMCSWRETLAVWPALLVCGGSFAVFQLVFATIHEYFPAISLFPMTDIGGGIFSLVVTAIFLQFWQPKQEWRFDQPKQAGLPTALAKTDLSDPHSADAAALVVAAPAHTSIHESKPLTFGNIALAWTPFLLMSVFLMLTGIVREKEGKEPVFIGDTGIQTNYKIPVPSLHNQVMRAEKLRPVGKENEPESAMFNFAWLTAPGTAVFFAVLLSMALLRMSPRQIGRVCKRTVVQMKIPIPTIAFMLGLSYVTRYAGMDATLGVAFANTGFLYPFFAAILGWLGVFLTGTDAGSNALFGSLQKITASQIYDPVSFAGLSEGQAQVLICTSNSTGGVMGKMIDAQSICVATAATHQLGREADIFKAVVWHSIFLATVVGLMTFLQAYVYPFTYMVPALDPTEVTAVK